MILGHKKLCGDIHGEAMKVFRDSRIALAGDRCTGEDGHRG
jgi:hypothetical protein